MKTTIFILVLFATWIAASDAQFHCRADEEIPPCVPCVSTCIGFLNKDYLNCPNYCRPTEKCHCQLGLLRTSRGECVTADHCLRAEHPGGRPCGRPGPRPPTGPCGGPHPRPAVGPGHRPPIGPFESMAYRNAHSNVCPIGEEVPHCEPCHKTCEDYLQGKPCHLMCIKTDECFCSGGSVRSPTGECIANEQCID